MRRTTVLVGVVLALGLSACGSGSSGTTSAVATAAERAAATTATTAAATVTTMDGSSTAKATTVAEAKAQMQADSGLTNTQAGCIVDKLVAAVGEAKALTLVNVESDLSEMAPADQKTAGDAVLGCVSKDDFAKLIADGLLDEMKDLGVTQEQATCVGDRMITLVTPEGLLGLRSGSFDFERMDPADQGKLFQIFVDCLPPDVMGKLAAGAGAAMGAGDATTSTTKG